MTDTSLRVTRRASLKGLAAAMLLPLLPGCSTAAPRPPRLALSDRAAAVAHLRQWIDREMKTAKAVNLSIAVLDDKQLVWSEGFGYADKAAGLPATATTRYRAGSISKVFTAMAAMRLAELGRLDIDAPLDQALPGFAIKRRIGGGPVTPRGIMSHHSGLPSDHIAGMWTAKPAHFTSLVAAVRDEYLAFPPGYIHAYSNLGFSLLGAAIEQAGGEPYERFMRDTLLRPMGMVDSAFDSAPPQGLGAALAYGARGREAEELALRDIPAGGLNTTVVDLLQLVRLWFGRGELDGRRVLGEATLREMQRPQFPDNPLDMDMVGLAWHFLPEALPGAGPVLWHSGGTMHHHAVLMLLPEQRLAVAAMSSCMTAGKLVHAACSKALALMLEANTGIVEAEEGAARPADPRYPALPDSVFPGLYDTPFGVSRISRDGNHLALQLAGQRGRLVRLDNGYYRLEFRLFGLFRLDTGEMGKLEFARADRDGHRLLLARDNNGFHLAGMRLDPVPVPQAWSARLGEYRYTGSDELFLTRIKSVHLLLEDGFLLVATETEEGLERIALEPVGDDASILRGLGRGRGDTVQVRREGTGEVLYYSGLSFAREVAA